MDLASYWLSLPAVALHDQAVETIFTTTAYDPVAAAGAELRCRPYDDEDVGPRGGGAPPVATAPVCPPLPQHAFVEWNGSTKARSGWFGPWTNLYGPPQEFDVVCVRRKDPFTLLLGDSACTAGSMRALHLTSKTSAWMVEGNERVDLVLGESVYERSARWDRETVEKVLVRAAQSLPTLTKNTTGWAIDGRAVDCLPILVNCDISLPLAATCGMRDDKNVWTELYEQAGTWHRAVNIGGFCTEQWPGVEVPVAAPAAP